MGGRAGFGVRRLELRVQGMMELSLRDDACEVCPFLALNPEPLR